ncbi:uncharacterized protein G2W53_024382 [Senna tora]|uniref:Uncharacterized protein n=1 Tax=Senna tora TaxID=362788 RepID=A0A834TDF3_9FABA|nr:uncharacterized protein G2W53_024382 [Senna tora]
MEMCVNVMRVRHACGSAAALSNGT